MKKRTNATNPGAQRLNLKQLKAWESLGYGMFIHFGMSTFDGDELSMGDKPSTAYAPDRLDVDQWVQVARDAGMKYAVLTAKHVAGHCLWPTKHNDYNVATSGNKTDAVEAFVKACEKRGVAPGLYYCSWDNHNRFGSQTPTYSDFKRAFTTVEYRDFQMKQVEELLSQYGPIAEMWIDIPVVLGPDGRRKQYEQIHRLQPDCLVMMNAAFQDGSKMDAVYDSVWPTDLMSLERWLPRSGGGYNPWHRISHGLRRTKFTGGTEDVPESNQDYYIPAEVCEPDARHWFYMPGDQPRSDAELLGIRLICRERKANLLLNVPPNRHGVIPKMHVDALMRLRQNIDRSRV
ncbi:MAG: alpha-L-fucosidase [Phycisphaeraceae bacterium]